MAQPEQAQNHPTIRYKSLHHRSPVHVPRQREVPFQCLILTIVPAFTRLLGQARPMTNHPFDQVMGQSEACLSPALAMPEIPPAEEEDESGPAKEQGYVEHTPHAHAEDHCRHHKLNPRKKRQEAAPQGEGFHGLRLHDTPKELASTLVAHLLGRQL